MEQIFGLESWVDAALGFAFYYPLFMSFLWVSGGLFYYFHWERRHDPSKPPALASYPGISIVVPCHNEVETARDTLVWAAAQDYPDFEVIAVDDGSTDGTSELLDELVDEIPRLRVVHHAKNRGKATALRTGALASPHDFLVCVDGDALLDAQATRWMMHHLMAPRVGAVTGNPRIRTRSTLLGKIQVGEFSSIIGLIKRAQRIYGRIFTVSGVIAGFRKTALHRVGYWSTDMLTEDIDITWRLQRDHWDIRYEPDALCWILMPETFKGLWQQRLRWAQGGCEVLRKYWTSLWKWDARRMWGVLLEFTVSILWAYVMASILVLWLVGLVVDLPPALEIRTLLPGWTGVVLGVACLLQFAVALVIDRKYERRLGLSLFWLIWYPIAYWMLTMLAIVVAFPKAMVKKWGTNAVWESPDRGYRPPGSRERIAASEAPRQEVAS